MRSEKLFDNLAVVANGFAGIANDVLKGAKAKAENVQDAFTVKEEIESLKLRIVELESRIKVLEGSSVKGKKNGDR